jgi:hypothetical protein
VSFRDRARPGNECWFVLDGEQYHVDIPTPLFLDVLIGEESWVKIVPGCTDDVMGLWTRLLDPDDAFDLPDCERVFEGVVAALTGWPAHAAFALAYLVDAQWAVVSMRATAGGQDLLELPVHRILDFAYGLRIENADEKDRREVDEALLRPRMPRNARPPKRVEAAGASLEQSVSGDGSPPPGFTVAEQQQAFTSVMGMIGAAQS